MLRATLIVASSVPNEGATSGSNAGVVKLSTNKVLYSARSIHWQRWGGERNHHCLHQDVQFDYIQDESSQKQKRALDNHLVQKNLAAVWSEVLQSCERFAQDLQQTALHSQQSLLLSFLSSRLPSTSWLFRWSVWGPLCPR